MKVTTPPIHLHGVVANLAMAAVYTAANNFTYIPS
jgi:hypothetical protein